MLFRSTTYGTNNDTRNDDSSKERVLRMEHGKGGINRDVPWSPKLLETLRDDGRWMRPKTYLFPGALPLFPCRSPSGIMTGYSNLSARAAVF